MAYFAEMTDTFGGSANYSWVRRLWIEHATDARHAMRLARAAFGWSNRPGRTDDYGGERHFWPHRACVVIMVRWSDDPHEKESAELLPEAMPERVTVNRFGFRHVVAYRNVLCPDGKRRTVRVNEAPDTFFSHRGRVTIQRQTIRGYVTRRMGPDGLGVENRDLAFHPMRDGGR